MAIILELILGLLAEVGLELIFELLIESLFYGFPESVKAFFRRSTVIEAIGYVIIGLMLGGASVLVFPESFIGHADLRILNLIVTPIIAGLLMMLIGMWRRKRGQEPVRLDSFVFGALFALSFELPRFLLVS